MPVQGDLSKKKVIYQNPQKDPSKASHRWWIGYGQSTGPESKIHKGVFAVCDDILLNLSVRRRMNYFFAALYNDTGAQFMASRNTNLYYNRTALDGNAVLNSGMSLNVLQNVIDTACSLISKNKPKPQFLTDGSRDYATKKKGKKLTKYIEGRFDEMKMYQVAKRVFLDSCIYGTGALKISYNYDKEQFEAENVFIEEILVDDTEGMHEKPTQLHQRKYLPRDVLAAMFPKFKEQIQTAAQVSGGAATFSTADIIPVIESWHLRSGKSSHDGLHSISIENCTLFSEEYDKDYYPILFFRWAHQTLGFWGRGIAHEIWKLQRELDIILQTIQRAQRLVRGPVLAVESGSNIQEEHLTSNKLAKVVEYAVTKPEYLLPPIVQPELYEHAQYIEDRMYKITGVSQSNATGEKPAEVKSGAAIREVADIAQGRFECVGQDWEEFFLDAARMLVDQSADLAKEDENLSVLTQGNQGAERINFEDVQVDMKDCKLQLFPVSGLASTPAGRLDQLMDYADAGYLSKEQVMDIVDFPDLQDTVDLETASLHLTQEILSQIKESGKYIPPGPYLTLDVAYRMACLEVDRAQLQNVKPEYIDLLRQWANEVMDLKSTAAAQQPAPQQPQLSQNPVTPQVQMQAPGAAPAQAAPVQAQG